MTCAYFVCGMQLVFLTTHLPSYLLICGLDPMLSAQTLGMIGGFNVLGSLFFGWAGQRWNKLALLGAIYILRSLALAWYFMLPATPATTLLFGAIMGFLWMGVGPLVAGAVVEMFGLKWQAMIQGLAFMSHQLGSFLGAYGGGLIYDSLGSYTMAWRIGVALGLAGGIIQVAFALIRPSAPPPANADGVGHRSITSRHHPRKRVIRYSRGRSGLIREAAAYWVPRFRGGRQRRVQRQCRAQTKTGPAKAPLKSVSHTANDLLDLQFLELDVLARDRVVLLLDQLVGHGARVLLGDVIEAGIRRGNELDLDGDRFGHVQNLK